MWLASLVVAPPLNHSKRGCTRCTPTAGERLSLAKLAEANIATVIAHYRGPPHNGV